MLWIPEGAVGMT